MCQRDLDCQTVLNDKVSFKACRIDEQVLYLYFDGSYTAMKPEQEILCRAALARTMTQIPGIDYISIYRGDQPLMDRQGNPVGFISAGDFIINTSNVNAYEKQTELTLYFANSTGDKLVAEKAGRGPQYQYVHGAADRGTADRRTIRQQPSGSTAI